MVYVCDTHERPHPGIQEGRLVREGEVDRAGDARHGSVWDVAFSRDPQQKYLYVADGMNMKICVLDRAVARRDLDDFGDGGRQPGEFYAVHSVATDSKGNLYTGETYEGKRVQKFNSRALARSCRTRAGMAACGRCGQAGAPSHDAHGETSFASRALGDGDRRARRSDSARSRRSARVHAVQAPRFEVDPLWPKPLPNHWVLGNVIGVGVDDAITCSSCTATTRSTRPTEIGAVATPKLSECCVPAPPVLEFDPAGNLVAAWGGPPADKATCGRRRTTASRSTTRATCGSAATAAPAAIRISSSSRTTASS